MCGRLSPIRTKRKHTDAAPGLPQGSLAFRVSYVWNTLRKNAKQRKIPGLGIFDGKDMLMPER